MSDCYWSIYNGRDKKRLDGLRTAQARSIAQSVPRSDLAHWLAWKEGSPEWLPLDKHQELFVVDVDGTASHIAIGDADAPTAFSAQEATVVDAVPQETTTNTNTISSADFEFSQDSEFNAGTVTESSTEEKEPTATYTKSFQQIDVNQLAAKSRGSGGRVRSAGDGVFEVNDDGLEIEAGLDESGFKADLRKSTRYQRKLAAEVEVVGQVLQMKTVDLSLGGCQLDQALPESAVKRPIKIRLSRGKDRLEAICQIVLDKGGLPPTRLRFLDVDRIDLLRSWLISRG